MNLGRLFEKFGEIKNVKIIEDRETQKSKGFGYVEFENKESVEKALGANGAELEGREVRVAKV
jgi:RNA recognition motif-containing protein